MPSPILWLTLGSWYFRRLRVVSVSGFSSPTPSIAPMLPDILEIFSLEGCTIILPVSFHGSNVTDFTLNRQVIQVYSSLVRSSDLKIANQNNNLLTTIIIDDPTADYIRTMEDICKLWYPDSIDWCSCSAIRKAISCDWMVNSNSNWP